MPEPLAPGWCQHCRIETRDATGAEIWPNRPDLANKIVWLCRCGARVGSHPDGTPLGTAANEELRRARERIHERIDPIWREAFRHPSYAGAREQADPAERAKAMAIIRKTARVRVYWFLACRLGLTRELMHVAMFDLDGCRAAWVATRGLTYDEVRDWIKTNPVPKDEKKPKGKKRAAIER